jgi:hypothetical protein
MLRAIEERGAEGAEGPVEVVHGADVVITMLPTAPIVLDVVEPLLEDWSEATIWLQDSNPRHADYDSARLWLCRAKLGRNGARMAHESHGGQHAQRVLTEEELLRDVWGFKLMGTSRRGPMIGAVA